MSAPSAPHRPRHRRRPTTRTRRALPVLTLAVALAASACSGSGSGSATGTTAPGGTTPATPDLGTPAALASFSACDDLLAFVKQAALDRVGPYGLPGAGPGDIQTAEGGTADSSSRSSGGVPTTVAASAPSAPTSKNQATTESDAASGAGAATDPTAHSETNVQEQGVDEPDTVKTDGSRLLTVRDNRLIVVDVRGPAPVTAGTVALPGRGATQILLSGNHVLAIDASSPTEIMDDRANSSSIAPTTTVSTALTLVDIADPANMKILNTVRIDGEFLSARMVDGQARVVTSSNPSSLPFVYPSASTAAAQTQALNANRHIIEDSKIEDWLPAAHIGNGTTPKDQPLLDCAKVSHPKVFSGFGVLSVVSVDVTADAVNPADAVGVMADGQTVYASRDALFVATPAYVDTPRPTVPGTGAPGTTPPTTVVPAPVPLQANTTIHKFGIIGRGPATYRASGTVEGTLLNQYSLSENEGALRVATTVAANGATTRARCTTCGGTETVVSILHEHDGALTVTGTIGDMGRGERVKAVRFIGKQGYVVTFRQTDPLYTLDLANPAEPKVVGELKILGYSAYLHPAGDGLVIGVGQDATAQGRSLGTKVSLFDVHDLANPRELQHYVLSNSTSAVEQDFHAFLWWQPTSLAMIPVERAYLGGSPCPPGANCASPSAPTSPFTGAIGLRIDANGITEVGRVVNPGGPVGYDDGCRSGVAACDCPPDAMCSSSGGAGTEPGVAVDCSKERCSPSSTPTTTQVICGTAGPCSTVPVPPCSGSDVIGGVTAPCGGGTSAGAPIERSIVVGDTVYTLSADGLKSSDLATLHEKFWLAFS